MNKLKKKLRHLNFQTWKKELLIVLTPYTKGLETQDLEVIFCLYKEKVGQTLYHGKIFFIFMKS